jgi:hypothetical protein
MEGPKAQSPSRENRMAVPLLSTLPLHSSIPRFFWQCQRRGAKKRIRSESATNRPLLSNSGLKGCGDALHKQEQSWR